MMNIVIVQNVIHSAVCIITVNPLIAVNEMIVQADIADAADHLALFGQIVVGSGRLGRTVKVIVHQDDGVSLGRGYDARELFRIDGDAIGQIGRDAIAAEHVVRLVYEIDVKHLSIERFVALFDVLPELCRVENFGNVFPFIVQPGKNGAYGHEKGSGALTHAFDVLQRLWRSVQSGVDAPEARQDLMGELVRVDPRQNRKQKNFQNLVLTERIRIIEKFLVHSAAMSLMHNLHSPFVLSVHNYCYHYSTLCHILSMSRRKLENYKN